MLQKRLTCVSQLSHEDPSDSMASGSQQALFQNSHTGIRHIQNGVIVQQCKILSDAARPVLVMRSVNRSPAFEL